MQNNQKTQAIIRLIGITAAIYLSFHYLLPLAAPFLCACLTAALLRPSACWLSRHLQITWHEKRIGLAPCAAAILELMLFMAVLIVLLYIGSKKLYQETVLLMDRLPQWIDRLNICLTSLCHHMEHFLSLPDNRMVHLLQDMLRNLGNTAKQRVMPYLMGNSMTIAGGCVGFFVLTVLFSIGVMLFVQEWETWKEKVHHSLFHEEFLRIGHLLHMAAHAYLRTQGIILLFTTILCTVVFFFMKNPYYILAGMGIGLLDALPILGTGAVLIPWAVLSALKGSWLKAGALFALYIVCYFLRQVLESKMMGDSVGLSPLETLISIYVGLRLFGLFGVLSGPVGLLLIKEFYTDPTFSHTKS